MRKHLPQKIPVVIVFIMVLILVLVGCNAFKQSESSNPDYKELKQMVIDILQTEDGKKAIEETIEDPKLKKNMVLNNKEVGEIVQKELLSPDNKEKLTSMYEDPKFAAELAKALKKENEKLIKDLMKDPEYRKSLIEVMNEKEFKEMIMEIMKSNEYRAQMMTVIKESFQSPLFKADLMKLMEEANKEALKPEGDKKKESAEKEKKDSGE